MIFEPKELVFKPNVISTFALESLRSCAHYKTNAFEKKRFYLALAINLLSDRLIYQFIRSICSHQVDASQEIASSIRFDANPSALIRSTTVLPGRAVPVQVNQRDSS